MTEFQKLVLRALGALLYCAVWRDHPMLIRQGEDARKKLIDELRDAVHRPNASVSISGGEPERERADNLGGFSFVDVTTEGCEGWLNLFWGGYPVALVNDVRIADQIRKAILEQEDSAEAVE